LPPPLVGVAQLGNATPKRISEPAFTKGHLEFDARRRHRALVRADGAIALGDAVGSIHRIGALAEGLEACNGWTFWHIERRGALTLIDTLRAEVRAAIAGAAAG
jgi:modification methylase